MGQEFPWHGSEETPSEQPKWTLTQQSTMQMDGVWMGNTFSLYSMSIANHDG
jgi:hypothetical protein